MREYIDIIRFNVGDSITLEYREGEQTNTVLSVRGGGQSAGSPDADHVGAGDSDADHPTADGSAQ